MIEIEGKIENLKLSDDIVDKLKSKNIDKIKEIISKSKTELKNLGLYNKQISEIEIKVELEGLKLKGSL